MIEPKITRKTKQIVLLDPWHLITWYIVSVQVNVSTSKIKIIESAKVSKFSLGTKVPSGSHSLFSLNLRLPAYELIPTRAKMQMKNDTSIRQEPMLERVKIIESNKSLKSPTLNNLKTLNTLKVLNIENIVLLFLAPKAFIAIQRSDMETVKRSNTLKPTLQNSLKPPSDF